MKDSGCRLEGGRRDDLRATLRAYPRVMGIVNITDDSFSGDGVLDPVRSLEHALALASEGADIIDVGAESARTNREPVTVDEEVRRLLPFVEAFPRACEDLQPRDEHQLWPPLLSVNTWRPEVVAPVLATGRVDILNDIGGLADDTNARLCFEHDVALLLMHTVGLPKVPHTSEHYEDILASLDRFFADRIERARAAGLDDDRIILDPGIDFAKQRDDNLRIYRHLERLERHGLPLLLPISRKTVIGEVLGIEDPAERDAGTLACLVRGLVARADIFRVHDVRSTVDSVRVIAAIQGEQAVS